MEKESTDRLQEIVELSLLYDFYGELLKENQKQIFEDYVLNNLSFGEIADGAGISRQGVYDIVRRCSRQLRTYEDRLHLLERFREAKQCIVRIEEIAEDMGTGGDLAGAAEIKRLAKELLLKL